MTAHILAIRGPLAGQSFTLGARPITIGRTPENAVIVDDSLASRRHAELRPEAGSVAVYDLGSANGTRVNGERVQTQLLRPGDVIEIANAAFRFELGPPVVVQTPVLAVVGVRGPLAGQRFVFVNGVLAFGRTPENHVVLASGLASRRHAEARFEQGTCVLRDLGSANGTAVNGQRVQSAPLRAGDVVEIGDEAFRLEAPVAQPARLPPTMATDGAAGASGRLHGPTAPPGVHYAATPPMPGKQNGAYYAPTALPPGVAPPAAPYVRNPTPVAAPPSPAQPRAVTPAVAPAGWKPPPPGVTPAPPSPAGGLPPLDPALAGLKLTLQCPTCKRSVDARYQDCPWDGTALVNGRTVW